VPAAGNAQTAIIFESKIALDDDGFTQACSSARGATSQCPTTLMLHSTTNDPCLVGHNATKCVPVDADTGTYVVIPGGSEKILGVGMGDYGMVLLGGRQVPVIVADSGPVNKIGEGSTKLLIDLSDDGKPHTRSNGVVFVLFPGSRDKLTELSPDTLLGTIWDRASKIFAAFPTANP
jgi:ABC-type Fe3+-hydroxamate transport system substrate-binding protein